MLGMHVGQMATCREARLPWDAPVGLRGVGRV